MISVDSPPAALNEMLFGIIGEAETPSLRIAQNKEGVGRLTRLGDDGEKYQLIISLVTLDFIMANLEYGT